MLLRKKDFQGRAQESLIKEKKQYSSKSLSRNYLAWKFTMWYVCINHKIAELLKAIEINHFPFIVKFVLVIKYQSHMIRMMKSAILSN